MYPLTIFSIPVPGGETIRQIIKQTGAHVELNRNCPDNAPTKYFMIRGETEIWDANVAKGDWGSVLVCLKPILAVAESDKSIGVKNLFVCVKQA